MVQACLQLNMLISMKKNHALEISEISYFDGGCFGQTRKYRTTSYSD